MSQVNFVNFGNAEFLEPAKAGVSLCEVPYALIPIGNEERSVNLDFQPVTSCDHRDMIDEPCI
jgi:hypothetical protein